MKSCLGGSTLAVTPDALLGKRLDPAERAE